MSVQSTNTDAGLTFTAASQVWIIAPNVVVSDDIDGVTASFADDRVENYGVISGQSDGMALSGSGDQVYNAASGTISGHLNGIVLEGSSQLFSNDGHVHGFNTGVSQLSENGVVDNTGWISGNAVGVYVGTSNSGTTLNNSGSITSNQDAVQLNTEAFLTTTINNSGLLQGGRTSISDLQDYGGSADLTNTGRVIGDVDLTFEGVGSSIVNAGSIVGSVTFGGSADTYDGRVGTVTGAVSGLDGNDLLIGGAGDEVFIGGGGRDRMDGGRGSGEDTFVFNSVKDSRPSAPDVITKHWDALDQIDMSAIDASGAGGFQHLSFAGAVAPGDALPSGKVVYYQQAGDTFVVADVTGDGKADFQLQIHGLQTLAAGEFVL